MKKFLLQRLLQLIPVLIIMTFIVFSLVYVAGDPVALMLPEEATQEDVQRMQESLGLNEPFYKQYGIFLWNAMQGDFGMSYRYNQDAMSIVLERLPATFELAAASMVFATIIAIPMGIWSATRRNTFIDLFITGSSVLGKAMPNFWLGIMFILLLAVNTQIFPVSGRGTIMHVILPAFTLGTAVAAEMTRLTRSNMIEILQQDYVRTAKAKGIATGFVVYKHSFRNALIPVITIMALQTSTLVGGAIVTEQVFAWPGIGQLLVQAVNARDMAIVQAAVFIIALLVIGINLIADILYRMLDPRIKF
ncbi:ABC transporter permease [Salisediminibacterium selenitireducens]|uniref:Binding-protein-dependent transport systems inner membrane component n=1 Tax=Bacillus selenitireducens (strain ATCC 700615 / DSM 15326 / MLS10) TaxID=439292 RepID=D6Y1A4_BACIE|nr:ABC transporter permease [Salisediminibacterium selenitireducens]ADI00691.1 binding-protein-dependent transport systems inner membrane component [[Bacillus] selenitireducens MLS10]